jgi:hypothetical protein
VVFKERLKTRLLFHDSKEVGVREEELPMAHTLA